MKKVLCSHLGCSDRRVHHTKPDTMRSHRTVKVDDNFCDGDPMYCSLECAMHDGAFSVKNGWHIEKRKSKSS